MIGNQMLVRLLVFAVACAVAFSVALAEADAPGGEADQRFTLSPPRQDAPIDVLFEFDLHGVNNIDSVAETFEFTGVMTLTWRDPREAFDPAVAGVHEKFYQGDYQFNEVATGWYPQVLLVNEAGPYSRSGVQLRVEPDGTSTLTEKITAVAETELDLRKFPFDAHRLEAMFSVLGHDHDEVSLRIDGDAPRATRRVHIPGWSVEQITLGSESQHETAGASSSAAVLGIGVAREAIYIRRLITGPMIVIVLLSFSIFWMEKSSLADRNSISLIGVLTNVAFQQSAMAVIPPVAYITLLTAFLAISFMVMAATVPINLVVAAMDKRGRSDIGDLIDRRCRWIFPTVYLGLVALITTIALSRGE